MGDETSVFVSYRRDDSKHAAGRLGERLHERFHLFMDIDNIRPGTDFTAVVRNAVDQADVVLAIIGTAWLASTKEPGTRRLDDPDDWVALEVGTALRRGTPVIPVLVDGARMPERGELPEKLADLASRQAITLDHESFGADCTRLIEIIESLAGEQEVQEVDLWADPDYPSARSALLQGQWARATEGLERVLRRHPRNQQVLDQLAEARRRQSLVELDQRARDAAVDGRWSVAVEALEGIQAIQPSDGVAERLAEAQQQMRVRSLQQDVRALAELGDWAAVLAADAELAALDPRSADIDGLATRARLQLLEARLDSDYRRGLRQLDAGEWDQGEATFAALLALRPGYRDTEALLDVARLRGAPAEPWSPRTPRTRGPRGPGGHRSHRLGHRPDRRGAGRRARRGAGRGHRRHARAATSGGRSATTTAAASPPVRGAPGTGAAAGLTTRLAGSSGGRGRPGRCRRHRSEPGWRRRPRPRPREP